MAANMDGVGTFEMADIPSELGLFTCPVKTYNENELKATAPFSPFNGITEKDPNKFRNVYSKISKYVCVDVANGYTKFQNTF